MHNGYHITFAEGIAGELVVALGGCEQGNRYVLDIFVSQTGASGAFAAGTHGHTVN